MKHSSPTAIKLARTLFTPVLLLASPLAASAATLVTVPMTFDASGSVNLGVALLFLSDSDTSNVTGTINTNVTLDLCDPSSPIVTNVQFLGGSTLAFSNVALSLSLPPLVNVGVDTANVIGDFTGSTPVTSGTFDTSSILINLNGGTIDADNTTGPPDIDLATTPLTSPPQATATPASTISAFEDSSMGNMHFYGGNLSVPVSFTQSFDIGGGTMVDVSIDGQIDGTIIDPVKVTLVPEPSSSLLLLASLSCLTIRRRR